MVGAARPRVWCTAAEHGHSAQPTSQARALLDSTREATYDFELHWDPPRIDLSADLDAVHGGLPGHGRASR